MMTCWLTQQWRWIRGGSSTHGFIARHQASCPECRDCAAAEARLIQQLKASAAGERASAPPFLHGKIMAALNREETPALELQPRLIWSRIGALAPAAILCLAVLLWMRPQSDPTAARHQASDAAVQQAILASAKYANGQLFLKLGENVENPLRREMAHVVLDAKTVMNGLACRFLPENALAANTK